MLKLVCSIPWFDISRHGAHAELELKRTALVITVELQVFAYAIRGYKSPSDVRMQLCMTAHQTSLWKLRQQHVLQFHEGPNPFFLFHLAPHCLARGLPRYVVWGERY